MKNLTCIVEAERFLGTKENAFVDENKVARNYLENGKLSIRTFTITSCANESFFLVIL